MAAFISHSYCWMIRARTCKIDCHWKENRLNATDISHSLKSLPQGGEDEDTPMTLDLSSSCSYLPCLPTRLGFATIIYLSAKPTYTKMQSTPRRSARIAAMKTDATNNASPASSPSDRSEFSDESSFSTCVPSADEGSVYSLSEEEDSSDDEPVSSRKRPTSTSKAKQKNTPCASKDQPSKSQSTKPSSTSPGKQKPASHHEDSKENAPNFSNGRHASPNASTGGKAEHSTPSPKTKTQSPSPERKEKSKSTTNNNAFGTGHQASAKAKPAGPTAEQAEAVEKVLRASKSGSFYTVLDVPRSATEREITKSYRKKALKLHPDKNPAGSASEAFRAVSEAYETLNSPTKRMAYDLSNMNMGSDASSAPRYAAPQRTHEEHMAGSSVYNTIPCGTRVTLDNLDMSSNYLNGLVGTVESFQHQTGQYSIRMDNSRYGFLLHVNPHGLTQNANVRVRTNKYGIDWYQATVTVFSYSFGSGKYSVCHPLFSGLFSLDSYEFIIPDGSIVRLEGLWNRPEYNGKFGRVASWTYRIDPITTYDTSYYEVQLSANTIVRAKMANVRL